MTMLVCCFRTLLNMVKRVLNPLRWCRPVHSAEQTIDEYTPLLYAHGISVANGTMQLVTHLRQSTKLEAQVFEFRDSIWIENEYLRLNYFYSARMAV